ncbi:hypothetical protein [Pacificoceanicola onchidii]|uniref:hypothetical protein n=1 Tax=Pacificoceanicola onchidii TaxID=2562685 RepID=UPI0010A68E6E|nr:hypothetical protein [Pacificoceanicola onchidii]
MHDSPSQPSLEFRIPLSPSDSMMRMVRYFLESIQEFGGPIGKSAHCALVVGDETPPFDLRETYPWMNDHDMSVHWVDQENFAKWKYDATGFERFWVESRADVVAMIDADLLVTGDFDDVILQAHRDQTILGVIAHVSPFGRTNSDGRPSAAWWQDIFDAAGVDMPPLEFECSAWGINFRTIPGFERTNIIFGDEAHRYGPAYFNAGVVIGPRAHFDTMGRTFVDDLTLVHRFQQTHFAYQMAHPVCCARHGFRCETIPVDYNFALNIPTDLYRSLNPGPDGPGTHEDTRIFHYIGGGKYFTGEDAVDELIENGRDDGAWPVFRARLGRVRERIRQQDSRP